MTSGIICCACSIPANSVLQFALKQWRKDDEPYCKGAVERIILDSVSPGKKSYENQNPWSTTAEREEGPGRPDVGSDRKTAFDYYYHEQLWKVSLQQATQSGMMTMLGILKSGKLILRCANDQGDPM